MVGCNRMGLVLTLTLLKQLPYSSKIKISCYFFISLSPLSSAMSSRSYKRNFLHFLGDLTTQIEMLKSDWRKYLYSVFTTLAHSILYNEFNDLFLRVEIEFYYY
jgi:hypothetical protein